MKTALKILFGLFVALISSGIVLGAISLSLVEGIDHSANTIEDQVMPPGPAEESTTPAPQDAPCIVPAGWFPYTVQAGDTLESLAAAYGMTAGDLRTINCLPGEQLFPGTQIHLPSNEGPTTNPPTN